MTDAIQHPKTAAEAGHLPAAEAAEAIHGHDAVAATEAAGHGGGGGGLPQFEFEAWGGQILWLLILVLILYGLLSRVFIPRMRAVLDERSRTISEAVETARSVQAEALEQARVAEAEVAEARANSQRVAAEARAKAQAEATERQASEDAKIAGKVAEAEERIREARDAAMTNVGTIATETAAAIVAKLTGQPAAKGELEAAIAKGAR